MLKPSLQVLAGHVGRRATGLAATNTSRLQRATTTLLIGGASAAVAVYFFLPDISKGAPTSDTKPLSPSHFTPAELVSSTHASNGTKLITIAIPPELLPKEKDLFAPIWSVFIKDDDIQVERPYTPLDGVDKDGNMKFWIKRYDRGEVSRWLHSKKVGESIEIRGPLKTWPWKYDVWDDIVLISGGTGITPFYQLMHTVFSGNPTFKGRITLLHSSRTASDLPPADVLDPLLNLARHNPDKFRLELFVDSFEEASDQNFAGLRIHQGRIGKDSIWRAVHSIPRFPWWSGLFSRGSNDGDRKILFLVCGPEQMVDAIAGPYGRNYSQGPIGGVLHSLGYKSHQTQPHASAHAYEVALFGEFFARDLKAILNRLTLHTESAVPMHTREILFEQFGVQSQVQGDEPALLRAKKELGDGKESGWSLFSFLKPESVRVHPEATVRPWATCEVIGDALSFASALGYVQRSQIYKRGYTFRRGALIIQMFQQEQVDPKTSLPIPAHTDTLWEVEVKTATQVNTSASAAGGHVQVSTVRAAIDAVLEVQLIMKGLLDLRRQDL